MSFTASILIDRGANLFVISIDSVGGTVDPKYLKFSIALVTLRANMNEMPKFTVTLVRVVLTAVVVSVTRRRCFKSEARGHLNI